MGIQGKFTTFDQKQTSAVADDMLARVLRDFTGKKISELAEQNRTIVGEIVPVRVQSRGLVVVARSVPVNVDSLFPVPLAKAGLVTAEWLFTAVLLAKLLRTRREAGQEDVLMFIARTLRERSPVQSGAYRDSHFLLADGREVASAADVATGMPVPPAKEYAFVSPLPYSRKIEVGKTEAGRDFVISVPNRVYQRTASDAKAKFPDADISFSYESLNGGRLGSWAQTPSAGRLASRVRRGNSALHQEWLTRQPTIFIRMA